MSANPIIPKKHDQAIVIRIVLTIDGKSTEETERKKPRYRSLFSPISSYVYNLDDEQERRWCRASLEDRAGNTLCHYCGCQLVPAYTKLGDPQYYDEPIIVGYSIRGVHLIYPYKPGYREATIDHIIPQIKGGGDHLGNLVLACRSCNSSKADRDYEEFIQGLALR